MPPKLIRGTSLPGAILLGLGAIVGTGAYVSIALATSITGSGVMVAILIAALVAACNGLSSAQLAAVHPVSGGTYEYGYEFLNHWFGFSAGWLFVAAKSASAATAALALSLYILPALGLAQGWQVPLALLTIAMMTLLVLAGLRRSNQANAVIVLVAIGALLVFVFTTFATYQPTVTPQLADTGTAHDIMAAAALILWPTPAMAVSLRWAKKLPHPSAISRLPLLPLYWSLPRYICCWALHCSTPIFSNRA